MPHLLRTIIADDEPSARQQMRALLADEPGVQLVAECTGGEDALEAIARHDPDLVLLDVQMPRVDGFDVAARIYPAARPLVVFVTGHDAFALRAFEASAIDYLLKPVLPGRLRTALERVRRQLAGTQGPPPVERLMDALGRPGPVRERLALRTGSHYVIVRLSEVAWIEASNNHVVLHTAAEAYRHRASMAEMEAQLDPRVFVRVHRSAIVNVDRVQRVEPWGMGEYLFHLADGGKVASSRRYRDGIREVCGL
jgi:two-component system, LytTR family, response regulator